MTCSKHIFYKMQAIIFLFKNICKLLQKTMPQSGHSLRMLQNPYIYQRTIDRIHRRAVCKNLLMIIK